MRLALLIFLTLLTLLGCSKKETIRKISGEAQGTTYHITYLSADPADLKPGIDSILRDLDLSLSTWKESSIISRINRNEENVVIDKYFREVFLKSKEVSERTNGVFDATVGPLVNAWGFGPSRKSAIDSMIIDSLKSLVGFRMLTLENDRIVKQKPEITVDFNAIAQGYSVDVLAAYLKKHGVKDYLVELGGELIVKGRKNGESWTVGIDQPNEEQGGERKLQAIVELHDRALATSGNYRKFYEEDGKKYAHILDPKTGYPAKQNILSATVLAEDGMTADAYATAFMVMGLEKSKLFLSKNQDLKLEAFFIYNDNGILKTFVSESLTKSIRELN